MRLSAFPFYAGIKRPLSGREAARKCVRVEAALELLECKKNPTVLKCVFLWEYFGKGCEEVSWKLVDVGKLERSGAGWFLAGTKSAMGTVQRSVGAAVAGADSCCLV